MCRPEIARVDKRIVYILNCTYLFYRGLRTKFTRSRIVKSTAVSIESLMFRIGVKYAPALNRNADRLGLCYGRLLLMQLEAHNRLFEFVFWAWYLTPDLLEVVTNKNVSPNLFVHRSVVSPACRSVLTAVVCPYPPNTWEDAVCRCVFVTRLSRNAPSTLFSVVTVFCGWHL